MADFVVKLWDSIFTPGPTPTLLRATNATFAALQVLLLVLLLATYSIHFLVLSILCGGLWYAINWFVIELQAHAEQEAKKARAATPSGDISATAGAGVGTTDDSDTEVEGATTSTVRKGKASSRPAPTAGSSQVETAEQKQAADLKRRTAAAAAAAADDARAESTTTEGTHSSVSTEDEWEKVSEAENEKDK